MGPVQRTIKQVWAMSRKHFQDMESSLNLLEKEMENGDAFNKQLISYHIGRVYSNYRDIADLLDVYKES